MQADDLERVKTAAKLDEAYVVTTIRGIAPAASPRR